LKKWRSACKPRLRPSCSPSPSTRPSKETSDMAFRFERIRRTMISCWSASSAPLPRAHAGFPQLDDHQSRACGIGETRMTDLVNRLWTNQDWHLVP
jgi:hypothetical protein